jgi:hypothetical protein
MRRWFAAWQFTSTSMLHLKQPTVPAVVFYDHDCVYTTSRATARDARPQKGPIIGGVAPRWYALPHGGTITMPDGSQAPVRLMSFAAPVGGNAFFVMAAPAFWEQAGVDSAQVGRDRLLTAVFLHEFTHTQQIPAFQRTIGPIEQRWTFPEEVTDDVVQERFGGNAQYRAAYERERDILYRAAEAPSTAEARALASSALAAIDARRNEWFVGENALFHTLDDIFLSFEGAGQWAGYAWLIHPTGGGVARDTAIAAMRRGGRSWTQDEGLALFLVVDRLMPEWRAQVFGAKSIGARELLTKAIARKPQT